MIERAARGDQSGQEEFGRRYSPMIRAYLTARWQRSSLIGHCDDAVQDVFLECFRAGGVLIRTTTERPRSFRAFLAGVTRNIALRIEERAARNRELVAGPEELEVVADSDPTLSQAFDRAWAQSILKEALQRQRQAAMAKGDRAVQRLEILRLRFEQGMPIREIAARWQMDPAAIHRDYLLARKEFREALVAVLKSQHAGSDAEAEQELALLRSLLP